MKRDGSIKRSYKLASERYAALGVDTDSAVKKLGSTPLSLHCWQGDDVGGFERAQSKLEGGGIQATGNYPGRARTIDELRADLDKAYSLIPGVHRLNLHAIYGEFGKKAVDRDGIEIRHFQGWLQWAKSRKIKLDFNATCFSHPKAASGFTLSSTDPAIREFWIEHVSRCREISAVIGHAQGGACVHNLWIPDGSKEVPASRWEYRRLLKESLDRIYSTRYQPRLMRDAVESKLFGIGSESFVVGSHEFYMGYALTNELMLCLDMGHFHPTESVADKLSAILQFSPEILLHVSRGIRWDSDHVAIMNDDLQELMSEIVRCSALDRVHLALDYFDASMNRVGAWVIGARATLKALLIAMLEPVEKLRKLEQEGNTFARLALREEMKNMPAGAVWEYFCVKNGVQAGPAWLDEVARYEKKVISRRK